MQSKEITADFGRELKFFRTFATVLAVVQVLGFVVQLAAGRSHFNAPLVVHVHAVIAMGWVAIFVTQAWLAASGAKSLHRSLGLLALLWAAAMVVLGTMVTVAAAQTGRVPFFFQPQHFLLANPATVVGYLVLLIAAVLLRRQSDWHMRLHIGAFVMIMGPSFGRLLPMPLLIPHAFEIACLVPLVFPAYGIFRDWRVRGKPHPAWVWPFVGVVVVILFAQWGAFSALGDHLYAATVAGTPGAGFDGRAFPPPPPLPPQ